MTVRNATLADLPAVLEIYARARQFMQDTGNPDQWGNIYPPRDTVISDIASNSFFLLTDANEIHAVFAFFPCGDSVYDKIDGEWLNSLPHAAVHRVASAGKSRGVLAKIMDFCFSVSNNIKIDTHTDNKIMQRSLERLGFSRCGTVIYPDTGDRVAYQKYL